MVCSKLDPNRKKEPEISLGGEFLLDASLFRLIIRQARSLVGHIVRGPMIASSCGGGGGEGGREKKICRPPARHVDSLISLSLFSAINVN